MAVFQQRQSLALSGEACRQRRLALSKVKVCQLGKKIWQGSVEGLQQTQASITVCPLVVPPCYVCL